MAARKSRTKGTELPATSRPSALIETQLGNFVLAPDEDPEAIELLRARLLTELRPRTAVAHFILDDILQVQLELGRVGRVNQTLVNIRAADLMEMRLLQMGPEPSVAVARDLARAWALGTATQKDAARRKIIDFGIQEQDVIAEAHASLVDVLALNLREEERLEGRRRKLLEDYENEAASWSRNIEDAEVLDDGA